MTARGELNAADARDDMYVPLVDVYSCGKI